MDVLHPGPDDASALGFVRQKADDRPIPSIPEVLQAFLARLPAPRQAGPDLGESPEASRVGSHLGEWFPGIRGGSIELRFGDAGCQRYGRSRRDEHQLQESGVGHDTWYPGRVAVLPCPERTSGAGPPGQASQATAVLPSSWLKPFRSNTESD